MNFDCDYIVVHMCGCETIVNEFDTYENAIRFAMSDTYGASRVYKIVKTKEA